jgi:hypothetical protein
MKNKIILFLTLTIYLMSIISLTSALTIESVSTSPKEIAPGESSTVSIEIKNDAEEDITDISVRLDLEDSTTETIPFAPYDSSSEDSFDVIKEDKTKEAQFKIIALSNAKSGVYKIPLTITYYDDGGTKRTKTSLISLTINSKPIITANIEEALLLKGKENKVIIKVINKEISDAKFLEVELKEGNHYKILSSKTDYIGDLDSDDFDSAEFTLYLEEGTFNSINLPIAVHYKDAINKDYSENYDLQVKVYTQKQAEDLGLITKSNTLFYIGVILVVVIVWIVYRKIKKSRKLKKTRIEENN